jgi:chromosome segregation ATPase
MATELTHSLSDEERSKLADLKDKIERFGENIETQQQQVDQLRHEKQKLEGLLENNLLKRKAEIQESSDLFSENDRRQSFRRLSTAQLRDQQKSELEERKLERDSAARQKDEVSRQLDEARKTESEMKKELMALAKRLDDLQAEDMKNVKAWEDSEHQSERFLTKVGRRHDRNAANSRTRFLCSAVHVYQQAGKQLSQDFGARVSPTSGRAQQVHRQVRIAIGKGTRRHQPEVEEVFARQ